jgi:ribosomal protein S6--L-glutamate ligase
VNICFVTDNPETTEHPVIGRVLQQLSLRHAVRLLDVAGLTGDEAMAREKEHLLADIYLLKSHTLQALEVAHHLEQYGALVINSSASSLACRDRVLMAKRMEEAHLPCPHTWSFPSIDEMLGQESCLATLPFPLIIKSRHSHRGDLVDRVNSVGRVHALAARRNREPFILQEFAQGDGWDIKLWVIDQQIFAARRRTPLEANAPKEDFPIPIEELPSAWRSIALEIGRVFNLRLYGVDLVMTKQGPVIVDINSFPGFRGVAGAASALLCLIERLVSCHRTGIP